MGRYAPYMMNTSCGAVYIGGDDRSINTHLSAHHHSLRTRYLRKSAAAKHEQPTGKIRYQLKFSKFRITLTVIQMILFLHLVIQSQFTVNFYYFLAHHHYEIFFLNFIGNLFQITFRMTVKRALLQIYYHVVGYQ